MRNIFILVCFVLFVVERAQCHSCLSLLGYSGEYWLFCLNQLAKASASQACMTDFGAQLAKFDDNPSFELPNALKEISNKKTVVEQGQEIYEICKTTMSAVLNEQNAIYDQLYEQISNSFDQYYPSMVQVYNDYTADYPSCASGLATHNFTFNSIYYSRKTLILNAIAIYKSYLPGRMQLLLNALDMTMPAKITAIQNALPQDLNGRMTDYRSAQLDIINLLQYNWLDKIVNIDLNNLQNTQINGLTSSLNAEADSTNSNINYALLNGIGGVLRTQITNFVNNLIAIKNSIQTMSTTITTQYQTRLQQINNQFGSVSL